MRDKSDLRLKLIARRAGAFEAYPDAGAGLAAYFPATIDIDDQALVAGYMPFRTEIDPLPLMRVLGGTGGKTLLPRMNSLPPLLSRTVGRGVGVGGLSSGGAPLDDSAIGGTPHPPPPSTRGGRGEALTFYTCDLNNQSHFETNKWGLLEPIETRPTATPNILLVPLLGFDRQGNRIGYGKGYYDSAIADLRDRTQVTTIGLAFAQQEVEHIPTQPHDQRLDWIITQNGAYRVPS
jgi:5-formyltetrahydrofolate cyclo-ligase